MAEIPNPMIAEIGIENVQKVLPKETHFGAMHAQIRSNISYCGDYLESPSIQGALYSGRKAAQEYLSRK